MKDSSLRRKLLIPLIATSFLGSAGLGMIAHGAELIFKDGFESYSLDQWNYSGKRGTLTNVRSRSGNYAVEFYLDRTKHQVPYRSELVIKGGKTIFNVGDEYWVGASIFIPHSWEADQYADILLQWHGVPDTHLGEGWSGRNPPLALSVRRTEWQLQNLWDSRPVTLDRSYGGTKNYNLGPYKKGQWTDWVFRIKWSYQSDGILEVWQDGQKVVSQLGPNTFNDQEGPYLKMGIYKPAWNPESTWAKDLLVEARTVYHDEVRIAGSTASYNDVAPGNGR